MRNQGLNKVSWLWPWLSSFLQVWLRISVPAWLWSFLWYLLRSRLADWTREPGSGGGQAAPFAIRVVDEDVKAPKMPNFAIEATPSKGFARKEARSWIRMKNRV